jgi:DNA polymerase epsilon subunit 3
MPRKDASASLTAATQQEQLSEGIENFELPKSIVTKIAKSALPENAKLQKDTVTALVRGSTVFINYLGEQHTSYLIRDSDGLSRHVSHAIV